MKTIAILTVAGLAAASTAQIGSALGTSGADVALSGQSASIEWGPGDFAGVLDVSNPGTSFGIPFGVADDSAVGVSDGTFDAADAFPGDTIGWLDSTFQGTDVFAATDSVNGNNASGDFSFTWDFSWGAGATLDSISLDLFAMGDFESSDTFTISYSIDNGASTTWITTSVDEAGSQNYTMEGGAPVTLDDPILANGTALSDVGTNFTANLGGALANTLSITISGRTDGGSESFGANNLNIFGTEVPAPGSVALIGFAGLAAARRRR